MLFDTHTHLDNEQLSANVADIVQRATDAGVTSMTAIGTDVKSSQRCVELAAEFDQVYAAVGIHPTVCHDFELERDWPTIEKLAKADNVVALGETGLDLHWDPTTLAIQKQWLKRHADLSFETDLPLVIHMRNCETEIVETLEEFSREGRIHGIMHSFSGSLETAKRCLNLGMYISFAGMVTFNKSDDLRSVAAEIPNDRLLVETDSPYLSPHPLRSKRPNEPSYMVHTAACLADVRNVDPDELAAMTTENARRVFGITD